MIMEEKPLTVKEAEIAIKKCIQEGRYSHALLTMMYKNNLNVGIKQSKRELYLEFNGWLEDENCYPVSPKHLDTMMGYLMEKGFVSDE